ncbi:DUF452 family protein [Pasteurellaceae bacterium 20609_3]|uniref:DUF452 family protein n=1 Tax=Spirabiliibacterium mucosae TaxID=28156 RepID=UPI001AADFFAC|nr:alpha/beta fold hydrolase [Spirabiliibacterium mucosae]MBE2898635.1 DUF452 family protein [Spirabiliibacterium mucosae]
MQFHWIHRRNSRNLILYFAGWSTPPQLLAGYAVPDSTDVLACFDYQSLAFEIDLSAYQAITVVAWSFGVWVAEQVLPSTLPIKRRVAINGTGRPVDDEFGIPTAVFAATLANMDDAGRAKFERRMCGTREALAAYHAFVQRPLAQVQAELHALARMTATREHRTFVWDKAIIGLHDRIMPAAHQQRYFARFQVQCEVLTLEAPHFVFPYFDSWQALCQ